jgi:hypothetical protein
MSDNNFLTPVGRMIQGDLFELYDQKDTAGRPKLNKNGEVQQSCFVGLAIPKGPEWDAFYGQLWQIANAAWPGGQANNVDFVNPKAAFSWKIADGDLHPNYQGKEGAAGCYIIKASNGFLPQVVNSNCQVIVDPNQAKKGYYYRLAISVKGNETQTNPGIYINCHMAQLVAYGQEIVSGPDANDVFGTPVGALPAGASVNPIAPSAAPAPAPGVAPAPAPGVAPAPAPAQTATHAPHPGAVPAAPVAPVPGIPQQ